MKKNFSVLMIILILLTSSIVWADDIQWEILPSKSQVSLDKIWTVKFNKPFEEEEIDQVILEYKDCHISTITEKTTEDKELSVYPKYGFSGLKDYTLKILLKNNKKYYMDFSTKDGIRQADYEPNDSSTEASPLYLNEVISGEIIEKDEDIYKIKVPSHGILNLKLDSLGDENMHFYVYGSGFEIDKHNFMGKGYSDPTGELAQPLAPGIYYIRIHTSYGYSISPYELEIDFNESELVDDNGRDEYEDSHPIDLNTSITGHVGYLSDYKLGNKVDYFKLEVPSYGKLDVKLTSLDDTKMNLYLYGSNTEIDVNTYMTRTFNQAEGEISKGLAPGTYYLKVYTFIHDQYSPYELSVNFYESDLIDDNGTDDYLLSELIDSTSYLTGHVGYSSDKDIRNDADYFKVELQEGGNLIARLASDNNTLMDIYIKNFNDEAIKYNLRSVEDQVVANLMPGVYYIKVATSYVNDFSPYYLELEFN